MKKFLLALGIIFAASEARSQTNNGIIFVTTAPSGSCAARANVRERTPNGTLYTCQSGTWAIVGGGGGASPAGSVGSIQTNAGGGTFGGDAVASRLSDLGVVKTSATRLTIGSGCSLQFPCSVAFGGWFSGNDSLQAPATLDIAAGLGANKTVTFYFAGINGNVHVTTDGDPSFLTCTPAFSGCVVDPDNSSSVSPIGVIITKWGSTVDGVWDAAGTPTPDGATNSGYNLISYIQAGGFFAGYNTPQSDNANVLSGYYMRFNPGTVAVSYRVDPHGNGTKVQMSDNSGTSGNVAVFDAGGNITDGPAGVSCTVPTLGATITVVNGIITALTGC